MPSGFVASVVFAGPEAYVAYQRTVDAYSNYARGNQTIGAFENHTDFIFMQVVGFDRDLRETDLDRVANDVIIGAPNLAIYGEQYFGIVELETVSIAWEDIAAVAFLLDIGAGYWNYDTWNAANDDEWTLVYSAQLAVGTLGLVALLASLVTSGTLLLNYAVLHMFFELGILGLTVLASNDTNNTTNGATMLSYAASVFGFATAFAAQVYHRVLK